MPRVASEAQIRATVGAYLETFSAGDREGWLACFADGATVEDPVGSDLRTGREEIGEFWDQSHALSEQITLHLVQGPGGNDDEAAFAMEARTTVQGSTMVIPTIDVMTFDGDGRILSQRAFWSASDIRTA